MTELDLVWSEMLSAAAANARSAGSADLLDYLRLKATNDAIRSTGVNWLIDSLVEIAAEAGASRPQLKIERVEPHSFMRGASQMRGSLLSVSLGVRCLQLQTGWTRTPADGVMRSQALAAADILHFGMPKHNAELRLIHGPELPQWLDAGDEAVTLDGLRRHVDLLLG